MFCAEGPQNNQSLPGMHHMEIEKQIQLNRNLEPVGRQAVNFKSR